MKFEALICLHENENKLCVHVGFFDGEKESLLWHLSVALQIFLYTVTKNGGTGNIYLGKVSSQCFGKIFIIMLLGFVYCALKLVFVSDFVKSHFRKLHPPSTFFNTCDE